MPEAMDKLDPEKFFPTWQAAPTMENNAKMLDALSPTIERAASTHVGDVNPLIHSKARVIALKSLNTYDPKRGRLSSHIYNHMQGLKRYAGQAAQGVKIPERVTLERRASQLAHTELSDEMGREPTDDELADRTGLSVPRLHQLRKATGMSSGQFDAMGEAGGDDGGFAPGVNSNSGTKMWHQMVYDDLAPHDQRVMEWSLGMNGNPVLENQKIAAKLRRSPGWVSQRKLLIQKLLDREQDISPF